MKNTKSIGENLMLSFRLKERFEESVQLAKTIYQFLKDFNLEKNEMEWLVTNWCKIKRDLFKVKSSDYLKTTIVDLIGLSDCSDLSIYYLLEEIRIYYFFK
jgi:hypothetical protein